MPRVRAAIVDDDAGGLAHTTRPEYGANGGRSLHHVLVGGFEDALEGLLHVFDNLVDDVVGADLHGFPLGGGLGAGLRAYVEGQNNGVGGAGQQYVALVDAAGAGVKDVHPGGGAVQPLQGAPDSFHAAVSVCLDDEVKLFDVSGGDLAHNAFQG